MNRRGSASMFLVAILCFVPLTIMGCGEFFGCYLPYVNGCGGHLKRASDANTIPTARQELNQAVTYLRQNNMTSGYTSIFYKTPDEDVGFWYNNLNSSLEQLRLAEQQKDMSQLEASNVLMKLRETLTDNGQSGTSVTEPPGIHKFPNNSTWCFAYTIAGILAFGGCIAFCVSASDW